MSFYSGKAKQYITNIFGKHNVKLEFDNPQELSNALEDVIRNSVILHIASSKKNLCGAEMKEYDVFKRQYLSNIRGYTYAWLGILADEKIATQIQLIKEAYYYFDGLLDLASPWAISYIQNTNSIEGYYYSFSEKNLLGKDSEFVEQVYDSMELSEKSRVFLRNLRDTNPDTFSVHYLAFDTNNIPRKMGYRSTIGDAVASNLKDVYGGYIHMPQVFECLERASDYSTEVGFQFIPTKNYFGIDINVVNDDVMGGVDAMQSLGIIGEEESAYMKTLFLQGLDRDISNVTWKFRWSSPKKFTIKQYNYYDRDKHPRFV